MKPTQIADCTHLPASLDTAYEVLHLGKGEQRKVELHFTRFDQRNITPHQRGSDPLQQRFQIRVPVEHATAPLARGNNVAPRCHREAAERLVDLPQHQHLPELHAPIP